MLEKELERLQYKLKQKNVLDKNGNRMRRSQYLLYKQEIEGAIREIEHKIKKSKEEAKRLKTIAHNAKPSALLKEMYEEFKTVEASSASKKLLETVRIFLTEKGGYNE